MNKTKKIVSLMLCCVMLFGMTLSASAATPRNNWCCPGAADIVVGSGYDSTTVGGNDLRPYVDLKCHACGRIDRFWR